MSNLHADLLATTAASLCAEILPVCLKTAGGSHTADRAALIPYLASSGFAFRDVPGNAGKLLEVKKGDWTAFLDLQKLTVRQTARIADCGTTIRITTEVADQKLGDHAAAIGRMVLLAAGVNPLPPELLLPVRLIRLTRLMPVLQGNFLWFPDTKAGRQAIADDLANVGRNLTGGK